MAPKVREAGRLQWCSGIFVVALLVRGLHVFQIAEASFFRLRLGDAESYHLWAQSIAAGNWLGDEVFYQAPLYPYFLGFLYATLGEDKLTVLLCQAVLGSLSCVFLALAGWRLFGKRAAIVAGLLLALYAPALFFESLIQKSVLDLFFLSAALWMTSELLAQTRPHLWVLLGLAMGSLVLTRENALVLVAPIVLWALQGPRGRRLAHASLFFAGLLTILLPVALRNQAVGGEFHLTTSQLGPNLFIGNREGADGTYQSLRPMRGDAKYERQDATELAEKALGRELTPGEVSSYYVGRVLDDIREEPVDWLRLMRHKVVLLWNVVEIVDTEDQYTYARTSAPLQLTGYVFHFGWLAPLGLLGIALTWKRRYELWPIYLMLALYAASVVAFYVFGRYRLPMVPFLVLFAAYALTELPELVRSRAALPAALVLVTALFCNWPVLDKTEMRALTHYNFGAGFDAEGDVQNALAQYRMAVELDPAYTEAHNNLGSLLSRQGELDEAAVHFREALRLDPDFADAHNNLGNLLASQDILQEADTHLREAIRVREADDAKPHYNLGNVLLKRGELDEAAAQYQIAISIDPGYARALYNLGNVFFRQGHLEQAAAQYERTVAVDPEYAQAHNNLGIVYATQGRLAQAAAAFERALEIDPDYTEAQLNLERTRGNP